MAKVCLNCLLVFFCLHISVDGSLLMRKNISSLHFVILIKIFALFLLYLNILIRAVAFGFFMKSDTNDVGFSTVTRSGITVAGPLCLPKDGVSGAGKCFDFASDSNDLFSLQALSYQNNLIGPWILDSVAEK